VPELAPAPKPVANNTGNDDDLSHTACNCDPDTALCGADVTDAPWDDEYDENLCIVCEYFNDYYDQLGTCCRIGAEHDCG
jgi:hypothetical protein